MVTLVQQDRVTPGLAFICTFFGGIMILAGIVYCLERPLSGIKYGEITVLELGAVFLVLGLILVRYNIRKGVFRLWQLRAALVICGPPLFVMMLLRLMGIDELGLIVYATLAFSFLVYLAQLGSGYLRQERRISRTRPCATHPPRTDPESQEDTEDHESAQDSM